MSVFELPFFRSSLFLACVLETLIFSLSFSMLSMAAQKNEMSQISSEKKVGDFLLLGDESRWFQITVKFEGTRACCSIYTLTCGSMAKSMTEMSMNACHILFPRQLRVKLSQQMEVEKNFPSKKLPTGWNCVQNGCWAIEHLFWHSKALPLPFDWVNETGETDWCFSSSLAIDTRMCVMYIGMRMWAKTIKKKVRWREKKK